MATAAGWYDDPDGGPVVRYWDGQQWTPWLSDRGRVWAGALPASVGSATALAYVVSVFLPEAHARGLIADAARPGIQTLINDLAVGAPAGGPVTTAGGPVTTAVTDSMQAPEQPAAWAPAPMTQPAPLAHQVPVSTQAPAAPQPPVPQPEPVQQPWQAPQGWPGTQGWSGTPRPAAQHPTLQHPSPVQPRVPSPASRLAASITSDLAVHGLAYLGVALLFIGVFGLVAFAFGDVTPGLRPVAELVAAVVPFVGARLLLRSGAVVAGRALELVGGLLLPLMVVTSTVDGFGFPPDIHGVGLVVTLAVSCLLIATAWTAVVRRHPASGLRFAIAPVVWLAAGMAALGAGRDLPTGQDVATPVTWQVATMTGALVATLAAARFTRPSVIGRSTTTAALAGWPVIAVLGIATSVSAGVPRGATAVLGMLLLVATELARPRISPAVVDAMQPLLWAALAVLLGDGLGPARVSAVAAIGFTVLVEAALRRGRRGVAVWLPLAGLAVAVPVALANPGWAAALMAVLTVWATIRRRLPGSSGLGAAFATGTGLFPAIGLAALASASSITTALVTATALVTSTTVPAVRELLRRDEADRYWDGWWQVAASGTALVACLTFLVADHEQRWTCVVVLAVLTVLGGIGPWSPHVRVITVTAQATVGWLMLASQWGIGQPGFAMAGLSLLMVAYPVGARGRVATRWPPAAVGLSGHALALLTLLTTGGPAALTAVVAAATAGMAVTAVHDRSDASPVGATLERAGLRALPWVLAAIGAPVSCWLLLDATGVMGLDSAWAAAVPAGAAVLLALVSRGRLPRRGTLSVGCVAVFSAVGAVGVSAEPWVLAASLAAFIVTVVALPRVMRVAPLVWLAWAAVAPVITLPLTQVQPWFRGADGAVQVSFGAGGVGAVLLVSAVVADLVRTPGLPRVRPVRPQLTAPWAVGLMDLLLAMVVTLSLPGLAATGTLHGDRILGAAVVLAVAAVLLAASALWRVGVAIGVSITAAWVGVLIGWTPWLADRPMVAVGLAAALAAAAGLLQHRNRAASTDSSEAPRPDHSVPWWSPAAVPLLSAAGVVAATADVLALLASAATGQRVGAAVGVLAIAVGYRLRRSRILAEVIAELGAAHLVVAAVSAGPGWAALTLAALAGAHLGIASRTAAPTRLVRQVVGALHLCAAWPALLLWTGATAGTGAAISCASGAVVTVLAVALLRLTAIDRSWLAVGGSTGTAIAVVGAVAGTSLLADLGGGAAAALVGGLVVMATSLGAAATPLAVTRMRDGAVVVTLWAALVALGWQGVAAAPTSVVLSAAAATLALGASAARMLGRRRAVDSGLSPITSGWVAAATTGAFVAVLGSVGYAVVGGDAQVLVTLVVAAAVMTGAFGAVNGQVVLQSLSPLLAAAAWCLWLAQSGSWHPSLVTAAISVALLTVEWLIRAALRAAERPMSSVGVVTLELVAVAFAIATPLVHIVDEPVIPTIAIVLVGAAVAGWGVLTRVRRRLVTGAATVVVGLALLVIVPLVTSGPRWSPAMLWIVLAVVGCIVVVAATIIEKARTAASQATTRFAEMTAGWE